MKIQLEVIPKDDNCSFHLMFNPRLSDLFFWHFHPEYELVYIEGATGTRHVGDHISTYHDSDLVLIGSNIPHLNFDYGVKTHYQKVVVHLKQDFVEKHLLHIPELNSLPELFEKSKHGIAIKGELKNAIGKQLLRFQQFNSFQRYLELITILQTLSSTDEIELLQDKPYINKYSEKEQERVRAIYGFIDEKYNQKIKLSEVAQYMNMSNEAFCRYFKKATGNTFFEFLNRYRISQSKIVLMSGKNVSQACYQCGFENLSYFNRIFKKITNENPSDFKKKYLNRTSEF